MTKTKSTKAIRTQLIAAIAMVLVAAIALGSSTYAWFANNGDVTATGMQVQAAAEGGIEIVFGLSTETETAHSTSGTAGMAAPAELRPTSTANATAWYHASAQAVSASAAKTDTYATLSLANNGANNSGKLSDGTTAQDTTQYYDADGYQYYLVKTFNIRSVSSVALAQDLVVKSVTVAGNSENISKSVRVAIVGPDGTVIVAPVTGATATYTVNQATSVTPLTAADMPDTTKLVDGDIAAKDAANSKNGGVDINIYVYYEGEDASLYTDAYAAEALTVTVEFAASVD